MALKIAMLSKFPPEKSGTAINAQYLVDELRKKCTIVTIGYGNSICDYKIDLNSKAIKDIKKIVEKEKIDVLHLQYTPSGRYLNQESKFGVLGHLKAIKVNLILARLMSSVGIPTVSTVHDMHPRARTIKQYATKLLEKKLSSSSTAVIVHSNVQKEVIEKYNENTVCIHHGVKSMKRGFRKGNKILFLGLVSPTKGVEYLIESMKYLDGFQLKVYGQVTDKKYSDKLKGIVSKNSLGNVEISFGWVSDEDMDRLYREANLVVLPYVLTSRYIISGALHDAIAYRIPIVVTNLSGMNEMIRKFKCGVAVEPFSAEALADGIKKIYNNYRFYMTGVDRYRKEASWSRIAEQHISLYKKLTKGKNK